MQHPDIYAHFETINVYTHIQYSIGLHKSRYTAITALKYTTTATDVTNGTGRIQSY